MAFHPAAISGFDHFASFLRSVSTSAAFIAPVLITTPIKMPVFSSAAEQNPNLE
jgi:hypothetical protein